MLKGVTEKCHIKYYQVCVPAVSAYNLVISTHRYLSHIKKYKLMNMLKTKFYIQNLDEICETVIAQCHECNLISKPYAGSDRSNYDKSPLLLDQPGYCWFVDEVSLGADLQNCKIKY